ncbi:MAG: hypothetical protein R3E10_01795 [Gemmatimonadota bacterium]
MSWSEGGESGGLALARRIGVLALVLLLVFGLRDATLGPDAKADDYAQYLLHARALVEGRPYADTGYLFSPLQWGVGPPVQSPGYPLTVAPAFALLGEQAWIPDALSLLGAIAFVLLGGLYFGRIDPVSGALSMMVTAVALVQVHAIATPGPDLIFCALLWAVAWIADREGRWSWGRTTLLALLAVMAVLYRIAALPLVPAFLAFGLLNWREQGVKPWLAGVATGGAFAWVFLIFGASRVPAPPQYVLDALRTARSRAPEPKETGPAFVGLSENLSLYTRSAFELEAYPFPWKRLNQAYHLAASLPIAVGAGRWGMRRWRSFGVLLMFAYVCMLLLLSLRTDRYLWPVAPVIAFGLAAGTRALLGWAMQRAERARTGVVVLVMALAALTLGRVVRDPGPVPIRENADVAAMFAAVRREAGARSVRVAFYKARTLTWEVGVPAAPLAGSRVDEAVFQELAALDLTHVIVGSLDGEAHLAVEQWQRLVVEYPERFQLVERSGDFALYRVLTS